MAALDYWVWLSGSGISPRALGALLRQFGGAESVYFAPAGAFASVPNVSRREAELLEKRDLRAVSRILGDCERMHIRPICLQDAAYPVRLKNIYAPPAVLYVKGELPAVDENALIALIGTRRATPYGLRMGRELAGQIAAEGGVIVSLLSSEIDRAAARAALLAGGQCVGVLATPHGEEENELVKDVAAHGAVVSEYPPGTGTLRSHFRERNRVAAGLSVGVVTVEAPERSGTRLFAQEAAEQGKEIFAVPGNADADNSVGTLAMLKEGAKLVTCGWDVLEEFEPLFPGKLRRTKQTPRPAQEQGQAEATTKPKTVKKESAAPPDLRRQLAELNPEQLKMVTVMGREPMHADDIVERSGLPTATVLAQLTMLEIRGYVRREPGRRFALNLDRRRT